MRLIGITRLLPELQQGAYAQAGHPTPQSPIAAPAYPLAKESCVPYMSAKSKAFRKEHTLPAARLDKGTAPPNAPLPRESVVEHADMTLIDEVFLRNDNSDNLPIANFKLKMKNTAQGDIYEYFVSSAIA